MLRQDIKKDFPIFNNNPGLIFLDSGASTQKPQPVIKAVSDCYEKYYANVHRGIYQLSQRSSDAYEAVREKVAGLINTKNTQEIIFTRNTTESINLVAYTWGRQFIQPGDEIIVTEMEHHANMLPWRFLAEEKQARLRYWSIDQQGRLADELPKLLTKKTKLVACTHMSNVLGTINPVQDIVRQVKECNNNIVVLVDGAQSVPHFPVDVSVIGADFYVFSSHKMCGPTGVGVLYGRRELLDKMDPFLYGGDMISNVTFDKAEWNELPYKFEAGTPNIAGVIGFGAAIDYLQNVGLEAVYKHEQEITKIALEKLGGIEGLRLLGPHEPEARGAVFAFDLAGAHPHDVGSILDEEHIAVRTGHHCTQPLHQKCGLSATTRASFYLYNTLEDIDALVAGLQKVKEVFGV